MWKKAVGAALLLALWAAVSSAERPGSGAADSTADRAAATTADSAVEHTAATFATSTAAERPATHSGESVTVYRDAYGTPHVVADSNRGVYYGYGYAVATDRLFQMEMLRRTTQGRVAEVLGDTYLPLDVSIRTQYDHRAVASQLAALPDAEREILAAYADGFSERVSEVLADRALLPVEFRDYGFLPDSWSAYDVAMLFVGSIAHRYSDFNSERDNLQLLRALEARHGKDKAWRIFNASKWLLDGTSPTTVPRDRNWQAPPAPPRPAYLDTLPQAEAQPRVALTDSGRFAGLTISDEAAARFREGVARNGFGGVPGFTGASNYWAVRDLEDAAAALLNGPQFGFSVPSYVYGIGLHGGDFNAVGNTLLALPALLFAHNNHIAWGSTAGISDQGDEYLLSLDPVNPERYRYRGGWRELERWTETIRVKGAEAVSVTARRSHLGMVMAHDPDAAVAWARARAWEGAELSSLMAWVWLATDRDLDAAHRRIEGLATNINMYTMDREGHLGYVHAGRYPQRTDGHDSRLPAPGDGAWDWRGLRPYTDNPTVRDPGQGYIANWNNRPRADWISSDLWTYTWGRADRASILFEAIEALPARTVRAVDALNETASFADVSAPTLLPALLAAADRRPAMDARAARAVEVLAAWDGQWRSDAQGRYGLAPTLMATWSRVLLREVLADDIGPEFFHLYSASNHPDRPLGPSIPNPVGIKILVRNLDRLASGSWTDDDYDFFNGGKPDDALLRSLDLALAELTAEQGAEMDNWHLQAHPMQWRPYNFRGVPQARESALQELDAYMNRGSENNLFIATGEGIEARDVVAPGQSGFTGAGSVGPHTHDQMALYAAFGYKTVPFTVEAVKVSAKARTVLALPPCCGVAVRASAGRASDTGRESAAGRESDAGRASITGRASDTGRASAAGSESTASHESAAASPR